MAKVKVKEKARVKDTEALVPMVEAPLESARQQAVKDAQEAQRLRDNSKAENTQRSYESDWAAFAAYCKSIDVDWQTATPELISAYLTSMKRKKYRGEPIATGTILRARSGISAHYAKAGFDTTQNPARGPIVKATLDGLKRERGSAPKGQKAPILMEHLERMLHATPNDLRGKRDRALLAVGFTCALRRSELVAVHVDDIERANEGVKITIRKSKTDQHGHGQVVVMPYDEEGKGPVALLDEWLRAAGIESGPVFRPIIDNSDGGRVGDSALSDDVVADTIKKYANAAGLDVDIVAGHSLRSGFASQGALDGQDVMAIMAQTRHQSITTVRGYIRRATAFQGNAAVGIWKKKNTRGSL